jgi:hypothetical protein
MNDPISVEARFNLDGTLRPIAFEWRGQRFVIASHGRQWEQAGEYHFLVMTQAEQVFELVYLKEEMRWQLKRSPNELGRASAT